MMKEKDIRVNQVKRSVVGFIPDLSFSDRCNQGNSEVDKFKIYLT